MPQEIRLWELSSDDQLTEISASEINLEERLENWLETDIAMLDPNLMIIGRQVRTDFGGEIDLLCLDSSGYTVIVELKKGKTPREVTAQTLDYASWVKELSTEQIIETAERYQKLGDSLSEAYTEKFGAPLPEILNQSHRALVVAEKIDSSTERIVRYLSSLGVPINVATVQYFKAGDGREILAQTYLVEPEVAALRASAVSGKRPYVTTNQMAALANDMGVGHLYQHLSKETTGIFSATSPRATGRGFQYRRDGRMLMLFVVDLDLSGPDIGLRYRVHGNRAIDHFGLDARTLDACLPEGKEDLPSSEWQGANREQDWLGFKGYFKATDDIDRFLAQFKT